MRILLALLIVILAGCDSSTAEVVSDPGSSAPVPYEGPLHVRVAEPDHSNTIERSGAAGRALECDGDAYLGSTGRNSGIPSGGDSREDGLVRFLNDDIYPVPGDDYHVERRSERRTLYSYDVDGKTKVAVVVAAGTEDVNGDGWGVETYAQCDPAEFAPEADDEISLRVWTDRNGDRVPTTEIVSQAGPAHCDWESVTFLSLGDRQYLRDPEGAFGPDDLVVDYDGDTRLPDDAVDTGYRLDEQHVWLAGDESSVYVVTPDRTERWPATASQTACM